MTTAVVIVAVVLVAVVVGWFLLNRQHPENAATHETAADGRRSRGPDVDNDRPAGPDAEPMNPDRLGGDQRPPTN